MKCWLVQDVPSCLLSVSWYWLQPSCNPAKDKQLQITDLWMDVRCHFWLQTDSISLCVLLNLTLTIWNCEALRCPVSLREELDSPLIQSEIVYILVYITACWNNTSRTVEFLISLNVAVLLLSFEQSVSIYLPNAEKKLHWNWDAKAPYIFNHVTWLNSKVLEKTDKNPQIGSTITYGRGHTKGVSGQPDSPWCFPTSTFGHAESNWATPICFSITSFFFVELSCACDGPALE